MQIHPLVKKILITEEEIKVRTKELAVEVSNFYSLPENKIFDNTILCIGLLKGCIPFMARFISNLQIECQTEYMVVSSYNGATAEMTTPKIILDLSISVAGRDVLIVEDIIDSGQTIKKIKEFLLVRGAKSVRVVTLLDKKLGRKVELEADWFGFEVPNAFLIGFGLDYEERLRNLSYVAIADIERIKTWNW